MKLRRSPPIDGASCALGRTEPQPERGRTRWRRPTALLAVALGAERFDFEWPAARRGKDLGKRRKGHGHG